MSKDESDYDHEPEAVIWARKKAGLTKSDLARALGVSLPLISMIEGGKRNATPALLIRMADVLNCPIVVLERKRTALPKGDGAQSGTVAA